MSTLNSTSTFAQIKAEFRNTASYAEDNDLAKAKRFKTAVIFMLGERPKRSKVGGSASGEEIEFDLATLQGLLKDVNAWIKANPAPTTMAGGVRGFSVENFRD